MFHFASKCLINTLNIIFCSKRFTDFSGVHQKASNVARALKNLKYIRLDIHDQNKGKYVGASTWTNFVHSTLSLKSLRVNLYDNIWRELHGQLFRKDSLPDLECLKLNSLKGEELDLKMLMSVSKKIRWLDLEAEADEFCCKNLEPTNLRGLNGISFNHPMFDMVQMTHIMTELEARPEFIVKYKGSWSVGMAQKLGKWLTLPNLEWVKIKATSEEEFDRAVQLCIKIGIALNRISFMYSYNHVFKNHIYMHSGQNYGADRPQNSLKVIVK